MGEVNAYEVADGSEAPALAVADLHKMFGRVPAVTGVTFRVPTGVCAGLVGPNGSGKSTTLRAIVGLVRPDYGSIRVGGREVVGADEAALVEVRSSLGVVSDPLQLFERLSAQEFVTSLADLRGLDPEVSRTRARELFDVLELTDSARRPMSGYSHGMKKKTALAAALIHRPALLLLDEPFEGVDPISARTMRSMIDRYRAGGGTVLLSSHVMEIVERVCDYVVVIAGGRTVAEGGTDAIRAGRRLEDVFVDIVGAKDADTSALDWLG